MARSIEPIRFEDVREGDMAPEIKVDGITRSHIVRYAGASGDFNPIHHDEPLAQRVGNPGVFAMGMMSAGFLGHMLTDWLGVGTLRRYSVRFASRVWPGDSLTCSGRVVSKQTTKHEGLLECELKVNNQQGEAVITGTALAAFPLADETVA